MKEMKERGTESKKSKWYIGDLYSGPQLMRLRAVGMKEL